MNENNTYRRNRLEVGDWTRGRKEKDVGGVEEERGYRKK